MLLLLLLFYVVIVVALIDTLIDALIVVVEMTQLVIFDVDIKHHQQGEDSSPY